MLLMQSDHVDLFVVNVVLELAYDTYPKNVKVTPDKEYEQQRDVGLEDMPEGGIVEKDTANDPNLTDEDNTRCKEMEKIRAIIESEFPPCGTLSKYIQQFFESDVFIDVSIDCEKLLVDKYLFLNMFSFIINCDEYGRHEVISK